MTEQKPELDPPRWVVFVAEVTTAAFILGTSGFAIVMAIGIIILAFRFIKWSLTHEF